MTEPVEPLAINTLSNVHVIEELIRLPVGSDTVIIVNSYNNNIILARTPEILSCEARKPEQT